MQLREEIEKQLGDLKVSNFKVDKDMEVNGLRSMQVSFIADRHVHTFTFAHANHMDAEHIALVVRSYLTGLSKTIEHLNDR